MEEWLFKTRKMVALSDSLGSQGCLETCPQFAMRT